MTVWIMLSYVEYRVVIKHQHRSSSLHAQVGSSGPRLQIVDGAPIKQGETHRYCVTAKGGRFTAVLVWTDYPASSSAGSNLVNDLDLVVRASGLNGSALLGNGGGFGDGADRTNNVEQIDMPLPAGDVSIEVRGSCGVAIVLILNDHALFTMRC